MQTLVTKLELEQLSQVRLREAAALLSAGLSSGAYYLAGYSIELALKACIAKSFHANTIPSKAFVNDIYVHDLVKLVGLAGLRSHLDQELRDPQFAARWGIVTKWTESSRYTTFDRIAATALLNSCGGVHAWIRQHW